MVKPGFLVFAVLVMSISMVPVGHSAMDAHGGEDYATLEKLGAALFEMAKNMNDVFLEGMKAGQQVQIARPSRVKNTPGVPSSARWKCSGLISWRWTRLSTIESTMTARHSSKRSEASAGWRFLSAWKKPKYGCSPSLLNAV